MKVVLNGVLMLFILYFKIFHTATSVHERLFFHARREIFTFSVLIVKLRTISSFPAFSRVISLSFIFSYQISRYKTVDVLVTDYGIAINPKRLDLYEILQKTSLPVMTVEELHQKAQKLAGVAEKTILGDRVCGLVEYRDGTIIDVVYDLP